MNEGARLTSVIVCTPVYEYFNVEDPHRHNIAQVADKNKAVAQHDHLCTVMRDFGVKILDIPELRDHPNSVFTRDTCVSTSRGFIQLRMGLDSRQGEGLWMAHYLESRNIKRYGTIHDPGTIEGGDVILAGDVVFVGCSSRSNNEGVKQAKDLFIEQGREVRIVNVPPPRLHIGGMMSMVGPRRVLCCQKLFPDGFFNGFDIISVPAETFISGNVICLGDNVVIVEKSNVSAIRSLREKGVCINDVDLSEFTKGRGGPTCLIMPLERGSD
jgi:dimethylargininase